MTGYHTADGYVHEPLDNRDEENPAFTVDERFSCTNTDFGGDDPATTEVKMERTFEP